jgi:hypothetical protein
VFEVGFKGARFHFVLGRESLRPASVDLNLVQPAATRPLVDENRLFQPRLRFLAASSAKKTDRSVNAAFDRAKSIHIF